MSLVLVGSVLAVALVDAINPSALAMTSYLVSRPDPWARVRAYIAGIFLTYLTVGLTVVFALSAVVEVIVEALADQGIGYGVQAMVGGVLIVVAARIWFRRTSKQRPAPAVLSSWGAFGLGVAITAVEMTTALPYLGALVAIVGSELSGVHTVGLLVAYNLIFIAPPVMVAMAARYSRGEIASRFSARIRNAFRHGTWTRLVTQVSVLLVGALLVLDATVYFAAGKALLA